MTDIAALGLSVDSHPVVAGTKALDEFSASAHGAASGAGALEAANDSTTRSARTGAQVARQAASAQNTATAATKTQTAALHAQNRALRAANHRRQQAIYQYNDIVSGLLMGQAPTQVALQQGGQMVQLYGGPGGLNNAFRDFTGLLTAAAKRLTPFAAGAALVGGAVYGMQRSIAAAADETVTMGDVMGGTFDAVADKAQSILEPILPDLADAWETGWQQAADLTSDFVNDSIREVLMMKVHVETAFEIMAATGEFTWERIQQAVLSAGYEVVDFVNKAIAGYNALASVSATMHVLPFIDQEQRGARVKPLGDRIADITAERDAEIAAIRSTNYARQAADAITEAAIERRDERKKREAENDKAAIARQKQRDRDRERALERLHTLEQRNYIRRLQSEDRTVEVIQARLNAEFTALDNIRDEAIRNGADATQVNQQVAQTKRDLMMTANQEIFDHQRELRNKELGEARQHAEKLARLDAQSRATIESLTMSGAFGTPQPGAQSFGEGADFALQDSFYREASDLAALEESRLQRLEFTRETGLQIAEIEQEYEDMRTEIRRQATEDRAEIERLAVTGAKTAMAGEIGTLAGTLSGIVKEGSTAYRALIAIQKGAALAQIAISAPTAAAKAMEVYPPPFGQIMAGLVYANVLAQAASVAAVSFGGNREFGGRVNPGELYEVGEKGRPELLRVGNQSFLIPGAGGGAVQPERRAGIANDNRVSDVPQVVHKHYHTHQYRLSGVETDKMIRFIEDKQKETEAKVPGIMQQHDFDEQRLGGGIG